MPNDSPVSSPDASVSPDRFVVIAESLMARARNRLESHPELTFCTERKDGSRYALVAVALSRGGTIATFCGLAPLDLVADLRMLAIAEHFVDAISATTSLDE